MIGGRNRRRRLRWRDGVSRGGCLGVELVADVLSVAPGGARIVGPPLAHRVPDDPTPVAPAVPRQQAHDVPAAGAHRASLLMCAGVSAGTGSTARIQVFGIRWVPAAGRASN